MSALAPRGKLIDVLYYLQRGDSDYCHSSSSNYNLFLLLPLVILEFIFVIFSLLGLIYLVFLYFFFIDYDEAGQNDYSVEGRVVLGGREVQS